MGPWAKGPGGAIKNSLHLASGQCPIGTDPTCTFPMMVDVPTTVRSPETNKLPSPRTRNCSTLADEAEIKL